MKTTLLTLIAIGSLAGCAQRIVAVPVDIGPCPLPPELVKMSEAQFEAFRVFKESNEGVVKVLNKREDQLQAHIDTLCSIIESSSGNGK